MNDLEARERVGQVEVLLEAVEAIPDPRSRDTAMDLVQALLDVYGEGLARIVAASDGMAGELAQDELLAHLLLLHGLHPVPLEHRVREALDEVRPYLAAHGGDVELLGVEDGVARLRLKGSCSGCPSSALTLKHAVEEAITRAAPDVADIVAEDDPVAAAEPALLQIDLVCPVPLPQAS
jgi:Fe-S cluster biogenesis protein NfuA